MSTFNPEEILAFVRAQLDEDERIARAVPDHRQRNGELNWAEVAPDTQPGLVGDQCGNVVTFGGPSGTGRQHAAHIVRHDPARKLNKIGAERRELDVIETMLGGDPYQEGAFAVDLLRLRALSYAECEGYRPEWRPA